MDMDSPEHDFVIVNENDVKGTDSSGFQPLSSQDLQEIHEWLEPTDYPAESSEYKRHLFSYVQDTDVWMQGSQFQAWLQSQTHGCLWFKAIPGVGKSVVAARLINYIQTELQAPVIFFFFRQIITSNRTPSDLLRDWLAQILPYSPYLQTTLKIHLENRRHFKTFAFVELWSELIKALGALPKVYCVVDALDEMSLGFDDFGAQVVALGEFKPATLKVCVTSRPVPRIEKILKADSVQKFTLEPTQLQPAVAKYIDFRLESAGLPVNDMAAVKQQLLTRSSGLFLYVKLMLDELLDTQVDMQTIPTKVDNLPSGLAAMYSHMLQIHSVRSGIPQGLQIAILCWVTHSCRPLRVLELAAIIDSLIANHHLEGMEKVRAGYPNTKAMIRVACGPLVVILEDETVGIIHHSLTEFIVDSSRNDSTTIERADGFPTIDSASSHRTMALTCLRYLCNGWADEVRLDGRDEGSAGPGIESMYAKYPFLRYASDYWPHHARSVIGKDRDLFHSLDEFMKPSSQSLEAWFNRSPVPTYYPHTNRVKESVIHLAGRQGLAAYIDHLVEKGHDVNVKDTLENTPLHFAAQTGHSAAVGALIRHGAKIDGDNNCGLKPLHHAANRDHVDVVRVLLEAGVDPMTRKTKENPDRRCGNAPRTVGHTPVRYAFNYGHKNSALAFAPYLKPDDLLQAVHWAAEAGKSEIVLNVLNVYDIDVNGHVNGKTLGYLAAYNHDIEVLDKLASLGAKFDILCNKVFDHQGLRYLCLENELAFTALHAFAVGCQKGSSQHAHAHTHEKSRRVLQFLLQSGCDIGAKDSSGNSLLHLALGGSRWEQSIDVSMIELFLENGADACATNHSGLQPLHTTTLPGPVVRALVKYGAKVNARIESSGKTPLHCCFDTDKNDHLGILLECGADCNAQDKDGNTPLHMALRESISTDTGKIKTLVDYGADPKITNKNFETPLHVMRKCQGMGEMLPMLLKTGADLEGRTMEGRTVLMSIASDCNNWHCLEESLAPFLTAGAKLEAHDYDGRNLCLQLCEKAGSATLLSWLVEKGADLHKSDHFGNNAFHYLARQPPTSSDRGQPNLFDTMLRLGVDPSKKNHLGQLPLHVAAGTRQESYYRDVVDAMDFLLDLNCGSDVNANDHSGLRPIHYAATISSFRVQSLMARGANASAITFDDQTILHIACRARDSNTVGLITEIFQSMNPALIDHVDRTGRTALHHACRSGRIESVKILLDAGASPNVCDKNDLTPLDACAEFAEENRLWSSGPTRDVKGRFTDAAGVCLEDSQRPRKQDIHNGGYRNYNDFRISSEDDAVGVRAIIQLLLAQGADMSLPEPVAKERYFYRPHSRSRRDKHFDYALHSRCEVLVDEMLRFVDNEADKEEVMTNRPRVTGPADERKYLERWMTLRYRRPHDCIDDIVKDRTESDKNFIREVDARMFDSMLRNEDEQGIMKFRHLGGNIIGHNVYPHGTLTTLARYGYASILSRVGPDASEVAQHLKAGKPDRGPWLAPPLHSACGRDLPNLEVLKVLVIQLNFDVNEVDRGSYAKEQSPLHMLAESSLWWKPHGIAFLAEHGANVDLKDKDGQTPLWRAVHSKATNNIRVLLSCGADPNIAAYEGTTCLNHAGSSEIVGLLLDHGASPTIGKYFFIFDAINSMDYGVVARIVQTGIDLNVPSPYEQRATWHNRPQGYLSTLVNKDGQVLYPIHLAASRIFNSAGKRSIIAPIIDLLLRNGADPLLEYRPGQSILHALCEDGGIIEPFLDKFNTEIRDARGNTLLLAACRSMSDTMLSEESRPSTISILLEKGADIHVLNDKGQNALHILLSHNPDPGGSNCLKGAFDTFVSKVPTTKIINQADDSGKTPLLHAVQNCHLFATSTLLSASADPSTTDNEGDNVLHHIAPYLFSIMRFSSKREPNPQYIEICKTFLSLGVPINASNTYGQTPLHRAFIQGSATSAMLQFFIDNGADVRAVDGEGKNLLHLIASVPQKEDVLVYEWDREERVKEEDEVWRLLTEKGGVAELNPSDEDWQQRSVWDLANASGNKAVLGRAGSGM